MNQQRECRACGEIARSAASQDREGFCTSRAGVQQGSCMTEFSRLSGFGQIFTTFAGLKCRQLQHQISLSWRNLGSDLFSQNKT